METIWIIGIGQFGLHALRSLSSSRTDAHFVLIDPLQEQLDKGRGPNRTLHPGDGVAFVLEHLEHDRGPDWIIPAVPVHLAAEWVLGRLGPNRLRRITFSSDIEPLLPHPIRGSNGNIYVSHADFRCPDHCPEPANLCTVTQKPRQRNMFDLLGEIRLPDLEALVIRSHQLGPGVGGYRPAALFELLSRVENARGRLFIGTACRCHGVLTPFERIQPARGKTSGNDETSHPAE
ncbi:MAG: potassium transporter [Deltaproteobacteria bacterium]|nr:potassium transporter [Deltaproteobacteria bacterium]